MFTRNGKGLTAKGVKPMCTFQQVFKSTYLFGAYSPFTGKRFELELPKCNSECFQIYTTCLYEIVQNIFFRNFELQGEKHSNSTAITSIFNDGIRNLCNYIVLVYMCKWYYLENLSLINTSELKIIMLDNGKFHKAKNLIIPDNIVLLFIPPYAPELNPSEKIWHRYKRKFTNKIHKTLNEVSEFIENQVKLMTNEITISTCSFDYIISAPFWTNRY